MQLGLVIYGDLHQQSGGYFYDRELVRYLRSQGDSLEVISLPSGRYMQNLVDNLDRGLSKEIAAKDFDAILQDELNHPSLFLFNQKLKQQTSAPLVSIVHHLRASERHAHWQQSIYRWVERRYLTSVDGYIFNSPQTSENVRSLLTTDVEGVVGLPGKDHISPNIGPDQARHRAHKPGPLRILFVGSLIPRKRARDVVLALARLQSDTWRLDIFGSELDDVSYAQLLRATITEEGLQNAVVVHGYQPKSILEQAMRSSHLTVMPSEHEGFGIAYLEGMGYGLPAIGSPNGGARSIIQEDVTGYLIPAGDLDRLSRRIADLINDREKLASLAISAMERYSKHPTWRETGEKVRAYLRGLLGSKVLE